jgi:hypothetical protein
LAPKHINIVAEGAINLGEGDRSAVRAEAVQAGRDHAQMSSSLSVKPKVVPDEVSVALLSPEKSPQTLPTTNCSITAPSLATWLVPTRRPRRP